MQSSEGSNKFIRLWWKLKTRRNKLEEINVQKDILAVVNS